MLCQGTCCAMRVLPHFSNIISNPRLNMYKEGLGLSLPNTSHPCGLVPGLFKSACLKSDQSSSRQTQKSSNLRCFYTSIQIAGFGLPRPAATLNSTIQTGSTQVFHRGREHLFECHKTPQPGPAVHSEPSLKHLHPNHTCTYFSKNRKKLSTSSLLTLVTQIQKYLQSS